MYLDEQPARLVDVTDYFMNLGEYDDKWSAFLVQQPQGSGYKDSGPGEKRARLYRDYRDEEVRYAIRINTDTPSCSDGVHNGDETSRDCGGSCFGCPETRSCLQVSDCRTGMTCLGYTCRVSGTCSDGVRNQDEVGIDCGGVCGNKCGGGKTCNTTSDCVSGLGCTSGTCQQTCMNGVRDGDETGPDCGGATCAARCLSLIHI